MLQICPSHLCNVATLPWEIQKSYFSTLLFIYLRLFTLPRKKTNSNFWTAALAVYLLLFSASCYLHSPIASTASGARYRRSACIDTDMLRLAAAAYCCDMGWISAQHGVPCEIWHWSMSKKCRQPIHTSEPPTFARTPQTFSQMKMFCNSQVSVMTFSGGVGKWITVCFLLR